MVNLQTPPNNQLFLLIPSYLFQAIDISMFLVTICQVIAAKMLLKHVP